MHKLTNKEKRKIKKAGYNAYREGLFTTECPYDLDASIEECSKAIVWLDGFDEGVEEDYLIEEE